MLRTTRLILALFVLFIVHVDPAVAQKGRDGIKKCPVPQGTPTLAEAPDLPGHAKAIDEFLSAGGQPADLDMLLIMRNLVSHRDDENRGPFNPYFENRGGVYVADFNGDGYLDVAVSIYDPNLNSKYPDNNGGLFVYLCNGITYQQIASPLSSVIDKDTQKPIWIDNAPKIIYAGDMNSDGKAEIVYDIGIEGASTLYFDVQIAGWDERTQSMLPLQQGNISFIADGGYLKVVNADRGYHALVVRTGLSGSDVAAGPQRQFTITYTWNGQNFVEVSSVGDPPTYRLHAAYDALYDLNHHQLTTAIWLYQRVLYDNTLSDYVDDPYIRIAMMSHAAYGLVIARVKQYGITAPITHTVYRQMQQLVMQKDYQNNLWFKYGEIFWQQAQMSNDINLACKAVNDAIRTDLAALPPGRGDISQLGLWPWFSYDVNALPPDRGLSFCPF